MDKYFTTEVINADARLEFIINDVINKFSDEGYFDYSDNLYDRLNSTLEGKCLKKLMNAAGKFRAAIKYSTDQELLTLEHKK